MPKRRCEYHESRDTCDQEHGAQPATPVDGVPSTTTLTGWANTWFCGVIWEYFYQSSQKKVGVFIHSFQGCLCIYIHMDTLYLLYWYIIIMTKYRWIAMHQWIVTPHIMTIPYSGRFSGKELRKTFSEPIRYTELIQAIHEMMFKICFMHIYYCEGYTKEKAYFMGKILLSWPESLCMQCSNICFTQTHYYIGPWEM